MTITIKKRLFKSFFCYTRYMEIKLNNINTNVLIKRNKLRQNTYFRFKDDYLLVTTGKLVSDAEVRRMITSKLKDLEKMHLKYIERTFKDSLFYYLGKEYNLVSSDKTYFEGDNLYIAPKFDEVAFYKKEAKKLFPDRLNKCIDEFTYHLPEVTLAYRYMKTRWGVCNTKTHKITLNTKLMRYDIDTIDYVIIHELSHLIEKGHTKRFWEVVKENKPNYKDNERRLKE